MCQQVCWGQTLCRSLKAAYSGRIIIIYELLAHVSALTGMAVDQLPLGALPFNTTRSERNGRCNDCYKLYICSICCYVTSYEAAGAAGPTTANSA